VYYAASTRILCLTENCFNRTGFDVVKGQRIAVLLNLQARFSTKFLFRVQSIVVTQHPLNERCVMDSEGLYGLHVQPSGK